MFTLRGVRIWAHGIVYLEVIGVMTSLIKSEPENF